MNLGFTLSPKALSLAEVISCLPVNVLFLLFSKS